MKPARVAVVAVALALLVGAAFLYTHAESPSAPPADAAARVMAKAEARVSAQPPGRQLLERPAPMVAPRVADAGELAPHFPTAGAAPAAPAPREILRPKGPVDRREHPGPRASAELERLSYAFETLDDDVQACLEQWGETQPAAPTQVMLAFELDGTGLQRAWVEHDGGVPVGPLSCFANVVYGLDWSHVVEAPAYVTKRFTLEGHDAG